VKNTRCIAAAVAAATLVSTGGCFSVRGSLASDTGPSLSMWSTADRQLAHVGERVEFSFVLARNMRSHAPMDPAGVADYCIATVGREMTEAELDHDGHYRFSYELIHDAPGDEIPVSAVAFRQRGQRDQMQIDGRWVIGNDPYDQRDLQVAADSLTLLVYASDIDLPVQRPGLDLTLASGRLEIHKNSGESTEVHAEQPGQPGFSFTDVDEKGYYHILYQPSVDELNRRGITQVRFSAPDTDGQLHFTDATISTP